MLAGDGLDLPATDFIKTAVNFIRPDLFVTGRKPSLCQAFLIPLRKLLLFVGGHPLKGRFQFDYAHDSYAAGFVPPGKSSVVFATPRG